jgi:hypothetical protein
MRVKNAADQRPSGCGKRHKGNPTILWASLSADESFFFEAIDGGGDRSAGEHDVSSDRINGERTFVQKNFQDGKVRDAEPGSGDTAGIDLSEGAVSLHQNEPEMDAGSVGWAGIWVAHAVIFISRYFSRKSFFSEKILVPAKHAKVLRKAHRVYFLLFSRCLACFAGTL